MLEELSIKHDNKQWWSDLGLKINRLPSTLRKLVLTFNPKFSDVHLELFVGLCGENLRLDQCLPSLEVFHLHPFLTDNRWLNACPSSLTDLVIPYLTDEMAIPPNLLHFTALRGFLEGQVLPHFIETLSLSEVAPTVIFPPSLTSLSIKQDIEPRNLPRTLTELCCPISSSWLGLPENLQTIRLFYHQEASWRKPSRADPENLPFHLLPKSVKPFASKIHQFILE